MIINLKKLKNIDIYTFVDIEHKDIICHLNLYNTTLISKEDVEKVKKTASIHHNITLKFLDEDEE